MRKAKKGLEKNINEKQSELFGETLHCAPTICHMLHWLF